MSKWPCKEQEEIARKQLGLSDEWEMFYGSTAIDMVKDKDEAADTIQDYIDPRDLFYTMPLPLGWLLVGLAKGDEEIFRLVDYGEK